MKRFMIFSIVLFSAFSALALDINDPEVKNAVINGDAAAVENMINNGLDVNSRDADGNTVLYNALIENKLEIARKLINAGADVNAPSSENGVTPLLIAVSRADAVKAEAEKVLAEDNGYVGNRAAEIKLKKYVLHQMDTARKMAELLIANGADVNLETPYGTPLAVAVKNPWNTDIIDILLKSGADVNARDRYGRTALFYAEFYGGDKISTKLLAAGADTDVKDNDGKTYLEVTSEDFEAK